MIGIVPAAQAQLSERISIDSQYRNRGYAVNDAKPVVTGSVSYDDKSGVYANLTAILGSGNSEVGLAGFQASLGYARVITPSISIEGGVLETQYARRTGGPLRLRYTEAYAGITVDSLTARIYYSPNYFASDRHTLYAELEKNIGLAERTNLNLHLGTLIYLGDPPRYTAHSHYDWRATISHNFGSLELYAGMSGRGPGGDYYARSKDRAVATFGAAFSF